MYVNVVVQVIDGAYIEGIEVKMCVFYESSIILPWIFYGFFLGGSANVAMMT